MNRRMRTRMYGGVGGRREYSRLLPDQKQWRVGGEREWSGVKSQSIERLILLAWVGEEGQ